MTYSDVIIKRLTTLCKERNITVNKLATLSGITQSTVENIMSGKTKNPKLKTLHKLAIGLNMSVSELLDFPEMNETIFEDERTQKHSLKDFYIFHTTVTFKNSMFPDISCIGNTVAKRKFVSQ